MSGTISTGATKPDSIYTWVFQANSGDSWGGWLVDDSDRYVVGSVFNTAQGRYTVVAEEERGTDLSALGLEEGEIHVAWYRDGATGQWLTTRLGSATAAGLGGFGSERDAAWTGTGWDSFGLGGTDQVDAAEQVDSLYTWVFVADSGDTLWGSLADDSAAYAVGDTVRGAAGTYTILTEAEQGRDLGVDMPEGTVRTTRYADGLSRLDLTLESGGAVATGRSGLGSEVDRAWDGAAWVPVGLGGVQQADPRPDTLFAWYFQADGGGDMYAGWVVGWSATMRVGDSWSTPHGSYVLYGADPWGGPIDMGGTVWVTDYFDSGSGQWLQPYTYRTLGKPLPTRGLGNESDVVWDGDEWDDFGQGGAVQADVEQPRLYAWYFQHSGYDQDIYFGLILEDATRYTVGDRIEMGRGAYVITAEEVWTGEALPYGTVWVTDYYDGGSGQWFATLSRQQNYRPVTHGGLGQEYDYVWDGVEWDDFGQRGIYQLDTGPDGFYAWVFRSDSGDMYAGWLAEDAARFEVGDTMRGAYGTYEIYAEWPHDNPTNIRDGTLWITDYYDGGSDRWLPTMSWGQNGRFASEWGIGNEYEYAWTGTEWVGFGVGGIHEIDVPRLSAQDTG